MNKLIGGGVKSLEKIVKEEKLKMIMRELNVILIHIIII